MVKDSTSSVLATALVGGNDGVWRHEIGDWILTASSFCSMLWYVAGARCT
jgi:hypothetical protein